MKTPSACRFITALTLEHGPGLVTRDQAMPRRHYEVTAHGKQATWRLRAAAEVERFLAARLTPASMHGKAWFRMNSGQANAVKARPGFGGNTVGPLNCPRDGKRDIRDV